MMQRSAVLLLAIAAALGPAGAAAFTPPDSHPVSRYEPGWQKNPFTLKTAPVSIAAVSFAKDLALAGWRSAGEDVIVTLVNTKTRDYIRLKNSDPTADGIRVKTAHLQDRRADTYVELERNSEIAKVGYDETFLKQMGAAQGATGPAGAHAQAKGAPASAAKPAMLNQPPALATGAAPGGITNPAAAPNIKGPPLPANRAATTVPTPQLPQSTLAPGSGVPTIQRRRLNTLPQPVQR